MAKDKKDNSNSNNNNQNSYDNNDFVSTLMKYEPGMTWSEAYEIAEEYQRQMDKD